MKLVASFFVLGVNMGHYFTNEDLKSEIKKFEIEINNEKLIFNTDNGVFSKGELDYGSYLLIKNVLPIVKGKVLDLGCGYGPIGCIVNKVTKSEVLMVDVNKRAVHLTEMNIKENNVKYCNAFVSNVYQEVSKKYDYIITNPPIRAGKEVVYKILFEASKHLKENGALYFVINKNQGALSAKRDLEKVASVEILEKNKGFYIMKATFGLTN